jgi:uncharacterized glyoxalase superfamily protein PhnB
VDLTFAAGPARAGGRPCRSAQIGAAHEYIVRVYGLTPGVLERDGVGRVIHGEVRAGDRAIWLHPASQDFQSPRSLGAVTGMTVITVEDADGHYARSVQAGAVIVEEPVDQPRLELL